MMACDYQFVDMTSADLPELKRWLYQPHVAEWWGDPEEQFKLISGDLDHPAMDQFIVSADAERIGYLQCYSLKEWNAGFGDQPPGTRGIDVFIGCCDKVDRGYGSALVRTFAEKMFSAGLPRMVSDPRPDNLRAIRAYEKAGFERTCVVDTPDGPALLMVCNP